MIVFFRGKMVWDNVKVADNPWRRLRGLLGRKALHPAEGLLIKPCQQVHCFFMKFAIDVIFLDRQNTVVAIHTLSPNQVSPLVREAVSVLEVTAGSAFEHGIKLKDGLDIRQDGAKH